MVYDAGCLIQMVNTGWFDHHDSSTSPWNYQQKITDLVESKKTLPVKKQQPMTGEICFWWDVGLYHCCCYFDPVIMTQKLS